MSKPTSGNVYKKKKKATKAKKGLSTAGKVIIVVAAVIAILIGVSIFMTYNDNTGYLQRQRIAAETENFKVNNCMMSYLYSRTYSSYYSSNSDAMKEAGFDSSVSLHKQTRSDGQTWYEFFADMTKETVSNLLAVAEKALSEGYTVDEADYTEDDASIETLASNAGTYGYSLVNYIKLMYGACVVEDDIRDCYYISHLATKYYNNFMDSMEITDVEYEAEYAADTKLYTVVDFLKCTVSPDGAYDTDGDGTMSDEETAAAEANAKILQDTAGKISIAASEAEFRAKADEYFGYEVVGDGSDDERYLNIHYSYSEGTDLSDWAFDTDRKVGDTVVIADGDNFVAYYMVKLPYRLEYLTKNVRHILFTTDTYDDLDAAKAQAEEVLAEYQADPTVEKFAELAKKYSEDTGSNTNGGAYTNLANGETVDAFNDWIYDEARVPGEVGLVESSYGWHLIYFESDGLPYWKVDAETAIQTAEYDALLKQALIDYPVTYHDNVMKKVVA